MTWVVLGMEGVPSPQSADNRAGYRRDFSRSGMARKLLWEQVSRWWALESPQEVGCSSRRLQLLTAGTAPAARERSRDVHLASTRAETGGVARDGPPIWIGLICREILPGQHRA